jgi:hypothetical protein
MTTATECLPILQLINIIIRKYFHSLRHELKISNSHRVCVNFLHVASSQQVNYTLLTEFVVTFTVCTVKEFHVIL